MAAELFSSRCRQGRPIVLGVLGLLCFSASLSCCLAVEFPLRWRWSNPSPHGNNIVDMDFSPVLNLAVQVTELGQLYTSADLRLWTPRQSGTTNALRGTTFLPGNPPRLIVTGESGTVLYGDEVDHILAGTLLDGPTTDWLEAVAASTSLLVAVGDRGAIYTSTNGMTWKRQAPVPAITTWLRGVAYGNGGFVAVGENGFVARSLNGTNWSSIAPITSHHLNRISFANSRYTAVGEGGVSMSSSNGGLTWTPTAAGATNTLYHVASGPAALLLVGEEEVWLEEASTWSNELGKGNGPPLWTYLSAISRPDYFLAAGRTGLMAEGFKTNSNPYFWIPSDLSIRHWLFDSIYATNLYVTVGDRATVMTSGNGVDWNLEVVPDSTTNSIFLGIGGTTNLLVTVGNSGSLIVSPNMQTNITVMITNSSGMVSVSNYTASTLGVIWHAIVPRPTTDDLQGVTYGHGLYLVCGDNGTLLTSPDGTNWTKQISPTPKLLSSAAAWPGGFVATGDDGAIVSSPDGTGWKAELSGTLNWIYKVRYFNGVFIAVGQNGTILTSTDASLWTPRTSGTSAWLNDVTQIQDTYFIVGTQGTVLTSSNLTTWTNRATITKKALYTTATDGLDLIVGGVEGVILRSPVVPELTPINFLSFARVLSAQTPSYIQNLFLFGGKTDQRFSLDRKLNLETAPWTTGPTLEIYDGDGTLFYLENILIQRAPPEEIYRTTLVP